MSIIKKLINALIAPPIPSNPPTPPQEPRSQSETKTKTIKHKVAGVTHYRDNILSFAVKNPQYSLSKKEMIAKDLATIYEYNFRFGKTELIPEPTNPYDPNAIKVVIDGKLVGYIKKGSCRHVLNLMEQNRIEKIEGVIKGGKYKYLDLDSEGNINLEHGNKEYSIKVLITER